MFLDTVNIIKPESLPGESAVPQNATLHAPWQEFPHSCISHHGTACCERAKSWFLAMDFSQQAGSSPFTGPRWIRQRYEWGPSKHPIYWCEAVKRKQLDCGALAALANEAFKARGVKSYTTQLVQEYSAESTTHWHSKWTEKETPTQWISKDVIYHEGNTVVMPDGTIRIWDASAGWWINPAQTRGYGSLRSVRIHVPGAAEGSTFQWGPHQLAVNAWQSLGED